MKPRILVTFDSMRYANTGLHTFGESLGRELLRQGGAAFDLHAYVYPVNRGFLGSAVKYVRHNLLHRYFFPKARAYDLVHFSDQYCRFGPARVRAPTILTVTDLNQLHELAPDSPRRSNTWAACARASRRQAGS